MVKRKWFDNEKILLSCLIFLSAAIRILFLLKFDSMAGDAAGHVEMALRILEDPSFSSNFEGSSSILYKYAIASFMYFWRDPVLAPRAFTSLFGILLVVPYYFTLKVLFDRTIAFFSSLVLIFYPLHVVQSSTTTSDAVYYFFLFSSFYYFFSYKSGRERLSVLLFSVLSFNIASLLRFESWIFIPVLFLLLWPKGKKTAFLFLVLSMIFPSALLALNQVFEHDFLYSFNIASRTAHASIVIGRFPYDPRLWSWLAVLWRSSGTSLVIGGLSGIVLAFLMRQKRQLAIFFLVLLSAFTVSLFSARMVCDDRYSIILGLFLIPYAWFFVDWALAFLGRKRTIVFILFLIFPSVGFVQTVRKAISENQASGLFHVTPPEIINIATWLKKHVRADEFLILAADPFAAFPANILIRSGISPKRYMLTYTPLVGKRDFKNKDEFEAYVLRRRPKYLVLNSKGYLQEVLNFKLDQKKQSLGDALFEVVFEQNMPGFGRHIIYRISYQEPSGSGGGA